MKTAGNQMIKKVCSQCIHLDKDRWKSYPGLWKCCKTFGVCSWELPSLYDTEIANCVGFEEWPPPPPKWWRVWLDRLVESLRGDHDAK